MANSTVVSVGTSVTKILTSLDGTAGVPSGVLIKAPTSNTDTVYIGGNDVSMANGFPVDPGEAVAINSLAKGELYAITASAQPVRVLQV